MKSLLIICDLSHCSHRIPGLSEELIACGWQVHVISPAMSKRQRKFIGIDSKRKWSLYETKRFRMTYDRYSYLGNTFQWLYRTYIEKKFPVVAKRFYSRPGLSSLKEIPDFALEEHSRWIPIAVNQAKKVIRKRHIDVVLSSSSPFSSHLIAREISEVYGIPWMADFRDLWSLNHARKLKPDSNQIQFEREILRAASATSTVTEGLAIELGTLFSGPIAVVHNAFHFMTKTWKTEFTLPLQIAYTGSIYKGFQNYALILDVLDLLNKDRVNATITFAGPSIHFIANFYKSQGRKIPAYVLLRNAMDRERAHVLQRGADLLLLMNWDDPSQRGVESTKFFEYLASGVPILATGGFGNDAIERILNETSTGFYAKNSEEAYSYLMKFITELAHNLIRDEAAVERYSLKSQASTMQSALEELIK